mmetsp:Transcript_15944/g.62298  ORF Transcript_15944/g.62298 Transcript_15944/m.62298 type:complete len:186 (+) Transcript_15944:31-588(+)
MSSFFSSLKLLNSGRQMKNALMGSLNEAGKLQIANYVRLYYLGSAAVVVLLGLLALIFGSWASAIIAIVVSGLVVFIELAYLMPPVYKALAFFFDNYLWRAICYIIFALPLFFSLFTFVGGVLLLLGSVAYFYCVYKGEKPAPLDLTAQAEDYNDPAVQSHDPDFAGFGGPSEKRTSLLSDTQAV